MSRSKLAGMTVLRIGALMLAVGLGGWLVMNAQRAADQDAGSPEVTPETPAAGGGPASPAGVPARGRNFLSTSKSFSVDDSFFTDGEEAGAFALDPGHFLPSSKSIVIEDPRTVGIPAQRQSAPGGSGGKAPETRGFLPSSKFGVVNVSDALKKAGGADQPKKKPDPFIFGSKSGHPLPRGLVPVKEPAPKPAPIDRQN